MVYAPRKGIEEEELRVRVVTELIGAGYLNGEIKKLISAKFGIKPRSVERYMARARVRLREEIGKSVEDLRQDAFAFYHSVIRDSRSSLADKLKARQRIDKMLAIDKPQQQGPIELIIPSDNAETDKESRESNPAIAQIRSFYGLRSVASESRSPAAPEATKSA